MTEGALVVIAIAVVVMAIVQVATVVFAARSARRLDRLATTLEQDIKPVVANLRTMTADAARVTALAAVQVERADRLFADLSRKIEQTLTMIQDTLLAPAREGVAVLRGLKAFLSAFRDLRTPRRTRTATVEDEDALFIG